jgi:hypothetical protein
MPRKVFTAGEVLAAADVNEFLMDQAVQSFAGTAARGSAIPSPVEGMTTFREDTDRLESWTGSQWTSPGDLVLIKSQTIGTSVSSVEITDAFSAAYDAYKIMVSGGVASSNDGRLRLKLGSSTTAYNWKLMYSGWTANTFQAIEGQNVAFFDYAGSSGSSSLDMDLTLINPFEAKITTGTSFFTDNSVGGNSIFRHTGSTSFTGFTILVPTGTITGGNISVFGYRKA